MRFSCNKIQNSTTTLFQWLDDHFKYSAFTCWVFTVLCIYTENVKFLMMLEEHYVLDNKRTSFRVLSTKMNPELTYHQFNELSLQNWNVTIISFISLLSFLSNICTNYFLEILNIMMVAGKYVPPHLRNGAKKTEVTPFRDVSSTSKQKSMKNGKQINSNMKSKKAMQRDLKKEARKAEKADKIKEEGPMVKPHCELFLADLPPALRSLQTLAGKL